MGELGRQKKLRVDYMLGLSTRMGVSPKTKVTGWESEVMTDFFLSSCSWHSSPTATPNLPQKTNSSSKLEALLVWHSILAASGKSPEVRWRRLPGTNESARPRGYFDGSGVFFASSHSRL